MDVEVVWYDEISNMTECDYCVNWCSEPLCRTKEEAIEGCPRYEWE